MKEADKQKGTFMPKKVHRNYKDTVFRMLYQDKKRALSLYNSINGTHYDNPDLLEYNTLENAIFMNVKNDLSFLIADSMNLYEHQSTLPVNLPLRNLFYIADLLQKMCQDRSIYDSRLIKIPNPTFVVFYNGKEKMPERTVLSLSDSFIKKEESPSLELKVLVININPGMNEELKDACPSLREYMMYVQKVRSYAEHMELREAVEKAVEECIQENILREFLMSQKSEVVKMSIYEYDEERELELIRKGEREIGQKHGEEIGQKRGREEMALLTQKLLSDNRIDDLKKASEDEGYREALCREYKILKD